LVRLEVRLRSLTTVSVTLNEPTPLNTCEMAAPPPVVPSPKFQLNEVIVRSEVTQPPVKPASGQLMDPSNATGLFAAGAGGVHVKLAVGPEGEGAVTNVDGPVSVGSSFCLTVQAPTVAAAAIATAVNAPKPRIRFMIIDPQNWRSSLASIRTPRSRCRRDRLR